MEKMCVLVSPRLRTRSVPARESMVAQHGKGHFVCGLHFREGEEARGPALVAPARCTSGPRRLCVAVAVARLLGSGRRPQLLARTYGAHPANQPTAGHA